MNISSGILWILTKVNTMAELASLSFTEVGAKAKFRYHLRLGEDGVSIEEMGDTTGRKTRHINYTDIIGVCVEGGDSAVTPPETTVETVSAPAALASTTSSVYFTIYSYPYNKPRFALFAKSGRDRLCVRLHLADADSDKETLLTSTKQEILRLSSPAAINGKLVDMVSPFYSPKQILFYFVFFGYCYYCCQIFCRTRCVCEVC